MSTQGETLYQPQNGSTEETWEGFSWPAFFFGLIWLAVKGLWGHFVVNFLLLIFTGGFAAPFIWLAYGCIGNGAHKKSLLKRGYLNRSQHEAQSARAQPAAPVAVVTAPVAPAPERDLTQRLRELSELRDKGVLTGAELDVQKAKLLNA